MNPSNSKVSLLGFLPFCFEKLVFWTSWLKLKPYCSYITCFMSIYQSVFVSIALLCSHLFCAILLSQQRDSYQCYWFLFQTLAHTITFHCYQSMALIIPCPGHYIRLPSIVEELWSFPHLLHLIILYWLPSVQSVIFKVWSVEPWNPRTPLIC